MFDHIILQFFHKTLLIPESASWVFFWAPVVAFTAMLIVPMLIPVLTISYDIYTNRRGADSGIFRTAAGLAGIDFWHLEAGVVAVLAQCLYQDMLACYF
ncbi:MAG: hypothetical protein WCY91_04745 [Acidithiobacillus sp.]|jgi:NADH:ubiquinone oxidoreductase subunit H|uniref:hypothetical protein n=1 Tax=Acidithiobacillus sp. TaxID=1872118 RepID=UPI00355CAC0E